MVAWSTPVLSSRKSTLTWRSALLLLVGPDVDLPAGVPADLEGPTCGDQWHLARFGNALNGVASASVSEPDTCDRLRTPTRAEPSPRRTARQRAPHACTPGWKPWRRRATARRRDVSHAAAMHRARRAVADEPMPLEVPSAARAPRSRAATHAAMRPRSCDHRLGIYAPRQAANATRCERPARNALACVAPTVSALRASPATSLRPDRVSDSSVLRSRCTSPRYPEDGHRTSQVSVDDRSAPRAPAPRDSAMTASRDAQTCPPGAHRRIRDSRHLTEQLTRRRSLTW